MYAKPDPATYQTCGLEQVTSFTSLVCDLPISKVQSQLLPPHQMEIRINLMRCGHLKCYRNTKNDSSTGCPPRQDSPSSSHPPMPRTPSSAGSDTSLQAVAALRSDCTAAIAVAVAGLVSDFYSHGKQASFFSKLYNTFSSIPGCQQQLSPTCPREQHCLGGCKDP